MSGLVDSSLGVVSGSNDFSVQKAGNVPGFVRVNYDNPFDNYATVVVTVNDPGNWNGNVTIRHQDLDHFIIQITDLASTNQDRAFSFIVVGE